MESLPVVFRPEAAKDIENIFTYIFEQTNNFDIAQNFTKRLYDRCIKIGIIPNGGANRDDLGENIQLIPFEKRAVILYKTENNEVIIVSIFYGGRDYDALMK